MSPRIRRVTAFLLTILGLPAVGAMFPDGVARADSVVTIPPTSLTSAEVDSWSRNCTLSQGYWKNHPESWVRVQSIALGSVSYDQAQLLLILGTPPRGNGLVQLAYQLIAAKLNLLLGAEPPPQVVAAIAQADALIGSLVVPPIGSGYLSTSQVWSPAFMLLRFNQGWLGPGHCPEEGGVTPSDTPTWGALKTIYR
jgi:hypothetical protein